MDNQQKNTYVKNQITQALIQLLEDHELKDISISDITNHAQVGRVSFYRNYEDKTDILKEHIGKLLKQWCDEADSNKYADDAEMLGTLFAHFEKHSDFYQLLYRRGLHSLLLDTIISIRGPKSEQSNFEAYGSAFIAYGIYGWIAEWFARGMTESAETMVRLLKHTQAL